MLAQISTTPSESGFALIDWLVLAGYFAILAVTGVLFARRKASSS